MGCCFGKPRDSSGSSSKQPTLSGPTSTQSQLPPPPASSRRYRSSRPPPAAVISDDMKPRGSTRTFDGLNFAAANFETRGSTAATTAPIKEEEESKERRADKRSRHAQQHTGGHKHTAAAAHATNTTHRPLTPNGTHQAQLRIDLFPSTATGGGTAGGVEGASVSHVSKNGVSFFPHFSFNDEGKEGGEEEGDEVSGRMEGEGEGDEKSRVSSTGEMDDDISIRYTTPTMASNHIVRPLPSPSSLSVPQPSIGSGIGSSVEHSMIGSVGMPYKGRMGTGREGSAFFPSVFSPKSSVTSGQTADMYGDEGNASSSPLSAYPSVGATASSPPSATSPLSPLNPLPVFPRPHDPSALPRHLSHPSISVSTAFPSTSSSSSSLYHPTTTIVSPPPPPGDHLVLNTTAVALASQLFDDSELSSRSSHPSAYGAALPRQQRSPRHTMQRVGSMPGGLRAPSMGAPSQVVSGSPPSSSPNGNDAPALSPGGMYRNSSQPSATDALVVNNHLSYTSVATSSATQHAPATLDDVFSDSILHSRAVTRPSLSASSLHTPSHSISSLRAQGSGQRSPIAPGRAGRERGKVGGDARLSDGLYSVSRGSDMDEDGSTTVSGAGGVAGVEEENELSGSRLDSGRSREESRLKALASMKT